MNEPIAIPGYRTLRELGAGGMATVHLAIQESFDREVALKIMSPMFNVDPSFATRFVREARIISQIHHASIVPVHDVGEYRRHQYLSMEYLPGGDLKHRLQQHGPNPKLALTVCRAISSALELAHKKGFVHRDIKPENILFREDGTPVLTDFGIARAIDSGTSLTRVGTLVGTPAYMSPEQIKGLELDGRSDLYSLGIVLFEMLTGSQPFRADSTLSLALKHITEDLPPLPAGVAQFQSVLDRLTARERDNRFATGADVLEALNRFDANGMLRVPAQAVASVRNPTPYHSPDETLTQLREVPPVGAGAQPPLIPRSTRALWIALGTAVISGAVGMTYMNTRPAEEATAETAQSAAIKPQIADPAAAQLATANSNEPMRAANAPALTPTIATNPPSSMSGASALPGREAREPSAPRASKPSTRAAKPAPVESAQNKPATTASTHEPMPEAREVLPPTSAPAGARSLQIPLNLIDHALWGEERWRDAAEPEKIARFLVDDIRILTLQMYAHDLGNGVASFGVRGSLTNSSLEERVVTLRIDLVNGSDTSISIPLEVEVDEQEEEEFDHELQMAAGNIRTSPATRVRITLSSKVPE
jgi:serine/threonine protein kinase